MKMKLQCPDFNEDNGSLDNAKLSSLEKQGFYSTRCLHELANDMTCVITSFALLEYELQCAKLEIKGMQPVQRSVQKMGETLRFFAELRRLLSSPLESKSALEVADTVQHAINRFQKWSFQGVLNHSAHLMIQVRWINSVVCEILESLEQRSGSVSVSVGTSLSGVLVQVDPENQELYCVITISCKGSPPSFFHENTANSELLVWREVLSQMKGWLQTRTIEDRHEVILVLPCEAQS